MTDAPAPLGGLAFSLVGPGRVGASLAAWAAAAGAWPVAVARRDPGRGGAVPGARAVRLGDLESAGQDLLLVAVPDGALAAVAAELARRPQAAVVLHTSGSLDASALAPLAGARGPAPGSAVGSFHPLKAFPRPLADPGQARGTLFGVDGDPAARALARRLAGAWGAEVAELPPETRTLYHFAASLAAGGALTLVAAAGEIAGRLGLPAAVARGYLELARGAVAAALEAGDAAAALTGPVARGDRELVLRQLEELSRTAPEKLPLARLLARETLRQCARAGSLTEEQRALLAELEPP